MTTPTTLSPKNTSGYKGVVRRKKGGWIAQIKIRGFNKHLGLFKTPEEASAAYVAAAKQLQEGTTT